MKSPTVHPCRPFLQALLFLLAATICATAAAQQRIVIAGDSTASSYPQSRFPRTGWGQVLDQFVDAQVSIVNLAVSGRSTKSYVDLGHFADLKSQLRAGDLLLIQFGHNDAKREDPARFADPDGAFVAGLMRFADAARAAKATPVLITPVARRVFNEEGLASDTHGAYATAVRRLAADQQIALIDLGQRSMDWIEALGPIASQAYYLTDPVSNLPDDTHFHRRGAIAIACLVVGELAELNLIAKDRLTRDVDCGVPSNQRERKSAQLRPSLIQHADAITQVQIAPHGGDGVTVASPLFSDAPDFAFAFRRRILHQGASIGLHAHGKDEVYYVLSGYGEFTLDGVAHRVSPGMAILTRDGSSHSLRQIGAEDLSFLIVYQQAPKISLSK